MALPRAIFGLLAPSNHEAIFRMCASQYFAIATVLPGDFFLYWILDRSSFAKYAYVNTVCLC